MLANHVKALIDLWVQQKVFLPPNMWPAHPRGDTLKDLLNNSMKEDFARKIT